MHPLLGLHRAVASPRVRGALRSCRTVVAAVAASIGTTAWLASRAGVHPAVIVAAPAPAPPPVPAPMPAPTPAADDDPPDARALVPYLDADCFEDAQPVPRHLTDDGEDGDDSIAACSWDDGFPAISGDGRTIATKLRVEAPDGNDATVVRLYDVATSRVRAERRLLDVSEAVELQRGDDRGDATSARVLARTAAVQHELEAGHYRAMRHLRAPAGEPPPLPTLAPEIAAERMQLVDRTSSTVVFRARYDAEAMFPGTPPATCPPQVLTDLVPAWDAATRTLFVQLTYASGGDTCANIVVGKAQRL